LQNPALKPWTANSFGVSLEYGTVRNLLNDYRPNERYGPSTPDYPKLRTLGDSRTQFTFGVRGTF